MPNNPTIVSASLDDKELQASINKMVANFDKGLQDMLDHTNKKVKEINEALKGIGNANFGAKGSNDGGVVKQTKAQNDFTDAVKKSTNEIKNQGKQGEMSFDQILAALQTAQREVRKWESHKTFSTQDLDKYQAALARVVELDERLRQAKGSETYARFDELSKRTAFDAKATIRDLTAVDDRLKQLNRYYKEEEKQSQKATAAIKENTQAKKENASVGQPAKSARDSYIAFMQGYKQQAEQIRRLMEEERKAMQQQRQGVVDGFSKTIKERKARVKELSEEVAKLYKERPDGYRDAIKQRTEEMNALKQKIRELTEVQKNLADSPIGASNRYLELEKEYNRIKNIMIDTTNVQRQSTQETERQAKSAQRYTDELKKQAAEIRKMPEWKQGKDIVVPTPSGYDAVVNSQKKLSLEEQLLQVYKQQEGQESQLSQLENTQNASANERLSTEVAITNEISKRKKYSAPETQVGYDVTRDRLAQIIATRNNIERNQVVNWDEQTSSIKTLSAALKQYQDAYSKMSAIERNSPFGKQMIADMQTLERNIQKFRQQISRPINFESVMNLQQKTLDDIAYKMRQLASYRSGLNVDTQKKEIQQVNDEYNRLKKRMDEVMQKNQKMISSNNALSRSWNYMKNRLAFYFTVGASTQFVKNLIEVRSQYEMNERALGILINSAERGTQIFNELSQMALVSPYTLIELSAAAKQLTAYDVAVKDVVDTTRRLADMAAAVGIPIERLTYALGQVKAYGYLNARDARMFANAGIPLVKNLSEYYTELEGRLVSTADIYDRIKKKQIGYEEVMSTISKMTDEGGKFYDFQAKMAETLKVQLANLTLAWNNMLNAMGEESQGVLVGGISTLKQLFLHWKDIEHVLYELVVALGAYKAYQIITTRLIGATSASLDAQVLAMKRNNAAMLKKQALTRTLTADEMNQVATRKMVTAADYQNALSGKQLTKQKALLLVALNKNNVQLKAALVNMGLLTTAEAASITRGNALAIAFKSIGISIKNAALAIKAFAASMWPLLVVGAIYELLHAWDSYGEHIKEVNKQAAEHAKEAFENIKQYLESESTINTRQRAVYKEGNPLTDAESQKAWDEMREKIELSSSASNTFIAKLMRINDINERLSAGFGYLEEIQRVAGIMQTLEKDAVNVSSTTLGGLFGEGLKDDLEDFINAYQKYVSLNENLRQNGVGEEYFNDLKRALEEFRGEVEKTTTSLYDIASKEGFNANEQREFFEREISEIAQAEQMGAKETRVFRMQAEKEYYAYARAQLVSQLEYQDGAQKALTQKRINDLDNEFGKNKALQESFFTWLTEKQDHAVKTMLRGKTQEEIKQGDWLKGANAKWVEEMARKFSKEYGVSFDGLHKLVMDANTWHINIPVFFQTIGQPLSDVQRDYEVRTGKKFSSNPIIKDAKSQVEILDILKKKQKEVAAEMETAEKAGGKYWEDNKRRYKEENDALIADIHAYNALTDAEEKANKKNNKGSKKDPLLDALKQEISLVEKLQSDYDKLSKSGASQADALETIRGAYGKTIRLLNTQLQSYGLPQINISQLITGKDPNKALEHFKQTLNTLVSKGMLTLERSKELEAVVEKFTLSAKTYNLDMITKGLNNELGKLKDEYELAIELDANPELGNMFTEMFNIDTSDFPKTINNYMQRVQHEFDKLRQKRGFTEPLEVFKADDAKWENWGRNMGLVVDVLDENGNVIDKNTDALDKLTPKFKEAQGVAKKWAQDVVKQTQDLQYKLSDFNGKIAIEEKKLANLRRQLAQETNDKQKALLELQVQDQQNAINKLKEEILQLLPTYNRLFGEVAEHSASMTRKLARDYKNMLVDAQKRGKNPNGTYTVIDPINGKSASVSEERLGKEIKNANKELGKTDNVFKKIKESLTKGEDGIVDWVGGIENIGEALGQVGDLVDTIGNVYDMFGNPNEYDATSEALHDIATSMQGVNTATKGIGQIASGDYIGGAISVISGLSSAIGTWFDNGDKKILQQIKDSERAVKRLELAYTDLDNAVKKAYGMATIGAQKAAIANKELQLVELKRQLTLEQSRKAKDRDDDRIIELQKEIKELQYDIKEATDEIVNDLLGISSVGDAMESMMDAFVEALRSGEDAMATFDESVDEMIANMVKKMFTTKILQPWFEKQWEQISNDINKRAEEKYQEMKNVQAMTDEDIRKAIAQEQWWVDSGYTSWNLGDQRLNPYMERVTQEQIDNYRKAANKAYSDAIAPTTDDIIKYAELLRSGQPVVEENMQAVANFLRELGLMKDGANKNLSALQQGIQGITEDTAGALEAYMNGVSQQVYLHSDLLTQIRDAVVGFDIDVQTASLSQILLQLQTNYIVMQSMQSMMEGWTTPSGQGIRVELIS